MKFTRKYNFRKDNICELFDGLNTTMLTIPNVTDVITSENGSITKANTNMLSITNHNVISSTFIQTSKSDTMLFSNDGSANSMNFNKFKNLIWCI